MIYFVSSKEGIKGIPQTTEGNEIMKRIAKRTIVSQADINATKATSVTYFPYPEYVEKVAYSAGVYGWTGSLYRGETSGLLYAVTDYGNDCPGNGSSIRHTMGARELAIVENLAYCEEVEHDHGKSVLRFVARDGHAFTVATFDHGRTWTICG